MAHNKECLIIVLDIRRCANEEFKLKSVKCAAEILKDKICSDKKDYVSFVLVGAERSVNELNTTMGQDQYEHIVEYPSVQLANWQLLLNLFQFVNEEPTEMEGEWLDALVVAMGMLKNAQDTFKFARQRILLCYDFNHVPQAYDSFDVITENLLSCGIELIVASHNIAYIDNAETGLPQSVFRASTRKSAGAELENQKYALKLISNCNASLCNFKDALNIVFRVVNRRPWTWTSKLSIGTQININISGIIAMKDESNIKLKKVWGEADQLVTREIKYLIKGTEVQPLPEELIEGYMLGGTPVTYDDTLVDAKEPHTPGLKFVGFVKRNAVPDEYYCGDSLYMIVHQKGNTTSARKLDALVRALHNTERAILCWKIFSVKFNQPKIVVLIPNAIKDERPATLSMLELSYHAQHHFWDFPALRTAKTECNEKQMAAVDRLIDSMDLELTLKDSQQPRQTRQNDLLPFDQLPHIYEQNVMDVLERKILCSAGDDEQFQEMLADKNFVEIYWKLPEQIEEKAKKASKHLEELFPLEKSTAWLEKIKAKEAPPPQIKKEPNNNAEEDDQMTQKILDFDNVGLETPSEDFEQLIKHHVLVVKDSTHRDVKFSLYANQMREVIEKLLQKEDPKTTEALERITQALKTYRARTSEFKDFAEFNRWLISLKRDVVLAHGLRNFWENVIVKHKLGLYIIGKPTLDDELRIEEFYKIETWPEIQNSQKSSTTTTTLENALDDESMDEFMANC